jgi:ribosomal protein L11 methylase PrmA
VSRSISFRDPAGHLVTKNDRIFRIVSPAAAEDLKAFLITKAAARYCESGAIVTTTLVDPLSASEIGLSELNGSSQNIVVEHKRIRFVSYPYEWSPEMLHVAALLTLDLSADLLIEGFGLKDATPYNVLFEGPNPVFVDLLSFERRDRHDPTWVPYAQFIRTFLLPLLLNRHFQLSLKDLLINNRDGVEPEHVYSLLGLRQKLMPEFLTVVSIPTWLGAKKRQDETQIYRKRSLQNEEQARFILDRLLKGLKRRLQRAQPSRRQSAWTDYMDRNRYTDQYFPEKEQFVRDALAESEPDLVLDVGCNTGFFSEVAAKLGAKVIAIDSDPAVVDRVWHSARSGNLDVQPLVVDLTRPSPAIGWRNEECSSFLDRARGSFDVVLMLAVIHHMLVSERIPLQEILRLAWELTKNILIVEFIAPSDQMFRVLTRGREQLHKDLTVERFEQNASQLFEIVRSRRLGESDRWIYLLRKREASENG